MTGDTNFPDLLRRLEGLLAETERQADPAAKTRLRAVVQALLDLHAAGLGRILDRVAAAGTALLDDLATDDMVSGLLLLHGMHPLDLETRVRQALDQVRPRLRAHGGGVELVAIDNGLIRLRLVGNCDGCPSSAATMRQTVEEAIYARAPDAAGIEVEQPAGPPAVELDGQPRFALPLV